MKPTSAICIPCDANYLPGLLTLVASIRQHNDNAEIVVISHDLDVAGCVMARPDDVRFSQIPRRRFPVAAFHFLYSLALDYDRVVWMGADQLCVGDLSPLLYGDLPPFAGVSENLGIFRGHHERVCTGLLTIQPKAFPGIYDEMMEIALEGVSYDGGDQGVVNEWLIRKDIQPHILPQTYDVSVERYGSAWWDENRGSFLSIHYVAEKPWNAAPSLGKPYAEWWGYA